MSIVGFIGDIHGHFEAVQRIVDKNPFVDRWFQVGDLGGENVNYPPFPFNFHFIQGNHENWDYIQNLKDINSTLFLQNGSLSRYKCGNDYYTVAAMGGNYSPRYFFEQSKNICQSRIRHFTMSDFDMLLNNALKVRKINVLITHEAPSPCLKFHSDVGIPEITRLANRINPDIHIFGHHHNFKVLHINNLLSICLDYGTKSYLIYDTKKKMIKRKQYS